MISLSKSIRKNPHWVFPWWTHQCWNVIPHYCRNLKSDLHFVQTNVQKDPLNTHCSKPKFIRKMPPQHYPPRLAFSPKGEALQNLQICLHFFLPDNPFQHPRLKIVSCVSFKDGNCFWLLIALLFYSTLSFVFEF